MFAIAPALRHADQKSRDSLACDLMEAVRPKVDSFVLDFLKSRAFKKTDFFETREGVCRAPAVSHNGTSNVFAKSIGSVTEEVAQQIFRSRKAASTQASESAIERMDNAILPTPLTQSKRSNGKEARLVALRPLARNESNIAFHALNAESESTASTARIVKRAAHRSILLES